MTRVITAAASFYLIASTASASLGDINDPIFIGNGSKLDFPAVEVGSSKGNWVSFGLGLVGRDENLDYADGPEFNLISGSPNVFSFDAVSCMTIGVGLDCMANVVFAPDSVSDFSSVFEISGTFAFYEIHPPYQGNRIWLTHGASH